MEAYAGLSNSARQALLTIVDKEFVEQLDRCQKVGLSRIADLVDACELRWHGAFICRPIVEELSGSTLG